MKNFNEAVMAFQNDNYRCVIKKNPYLGVWCGYVELPESHPVYQQEYELLHTLDVHGGITYSAFGIPGTYLKGWWIGFDCGHAGDFIPCIESINEILLLKGMPEITSIKNINKTTFKDQDFVKQELIQLVNQLKEMEKHHGKSDTKL